MRHTHNLELTVTDTPLVLDRVVAICRARLATQKLASLPGVLAVAAIGAGAERAEVHTAGVAEGAVIASARA